jgi:hypothetical protein
MSFLTVPFDLAQTNRLRELLQVSAGRSVSAANILEALENGIENEGAAELSLSREARRSPLVSDAKRRKLEAVRASRKS